MTNPKLKFNIEERKKNCLYASDAGKLEADIILQLRGVEPTNPPEWSTSLKWEAGKAVEMQMIKILKENGHIDPTYEQDNFPTTVIHREGVEIHMKFDAKVINSVLQCEHGMLPQNNLVDLRDGEPLEIKSINNANVVDVQKYIAGQPRENYVMQLSMYM